MSNILVAYFSTSGVTQNVADKIAQIVSSPAINLGFSRD